MGREEVNEETTVLIGQNIEYLNQEFEGRIKFKLDQLFLNREHVFIPDLHSDYVNATKNDIMKTVKDLEVKGGINVFLFDTYTKNDGYTAMMGFTPVLSAHHSTYANNSPRFDRLFLAYPSLGDMSTIVHEMGHFLGLSHPWEMHQLDLEFMGLNKDSESRNHMTYHPEVDHFTTEQLDRMHHFALQFRRYLLSHIELAY